MEDTALLIEMLKSTAMLFFWMKKSQTDVKSFMHGEMFILDILECENGAVLPGELSSRMESSSASIAVALKNLEKKGYIERNIDKTDRRKILVTITDDGLKFIRRQHEILEGRMRLILNELGVDDAREYIRIVRRIADITQKN